MKKNNLKYVYSVAGTILVAALGSMFVGLGMGWYKNLNKPKIWVNDALIPVMWTLIYAVAMVILILISKKKKMSKKTMWLFIINGALNVLWCLVFFTFKNPFLGQVVIIINLIFAYLLTYNLLEEKKEYGYSMIIYPVWVSVATSLNLILWSLN